MARVFNFSAGPATLPEETLVEAQAQLVDYQGCGMSIMESSHRGKEYDAVHQEAIANIRKIMNLPDHYSVVFMTGGATAQFALIPMNFLGEGEVADYTNTGAWAGKAIKEAQIVGNVNVAADTSKASPARMPTQDELNCSEKAAYFHLTSNETIAGTQWKTFPSVSAPLVGDMSSDMLSRPFDVSPFGLIYAGAQKNLGPAGVTLVIVRNDMLEKVNENVPMIFRYKTHAEKDSLYNTPPCFPIYMLMLTTRWLLKQGGLDAVAQMNADKAKLLYDAIDGTDFYSGTADVASRSDMNVTFRLPSEELEAQFVKEAAEQGMKGLKGHRSVGGIRASIYNAMPRAGVETLVEFMRAFEAKNG